ncbi:MAG: GNAT family N-acetyltransferase [Steroidobacteraceae bacterium]
MEFDLQPVLRGEHLTLRPMLAADLEPLWDVARDPLLWQQHPDQTRHTRIGFERFFEAALAGHALIVADRASGRVMGSTRYYEWDAAAQEVAIGFTFLAREYWGGHANREMKRLLIEHAAPHVQKIWFHVGKHNLRSRRAMQKIGAAQAYEAQRPQNGELMDFVYYCIEPARWRPAQ